MVDMKLDPRWLNDVQETLKHLLIEAARDGETSETQAEKLATFALNGFTSLSEQWKDISSIPSVAIRLSEKTDALQRRILALHQQITGKSFNQGYGEENDYPRTRVGFALERFGSASCDLHLISGVLDSIEAALATSTEDWAEVLDQRQREIDAAKERVIPLPEKSTSPSVSTGPFKYKLGFAQDYGVNITCYFPSQSELETISSEVLKQFCTDLGYGHSTGDYCSIVKGLHERFAGKILVEIHRAAVLAPGECIGAFDVQADDIHFSAIPQSLRTPLQYAEHEHPKC